MGNIEQLGNSIDFLFKKGIKNVSRFDLMVVVDSLNPHNSIAAMNESYYEEAKKCLIKIAYIYCSIPRESMIAYGFDEIASVLKRSYSDMTLEEIVLAFELAALRKIDANLTSYGAGFNLQMVGEVLEEYKKWKMSVKWNLLEFGGQITGGKELEYKDIKVAEWWFNIIAKVRAGGDMPNWKLLPIGLLVELNDSGFLDYEGNEVAKKECYKKGIDIYVEEVRELKSSNNVMSYTEKIEIEGLLMKVREWRENGSNLSRDLVPQKLRENGWIYGLKLYAIDYIEKMLKGVIV